MKHITTIEAELNSMAKRLAAIRDETESKILADYLTGCINELYRAINATKLSETH